MLEDLDIGAISIDLPIPAKVITCTIEGAIEAEDLRRLLDRRSAAEVPMGLQAGDLAKVREQHHVVARYVASGMQQTIIASLTGYTEAYVSVLLNNPAMQELIGYYRSNHINAAAAVGEKLKHVALKAVEKLEGQLDDDELGANELIQVAKLGLDRSGHGPSSKVVNETTHHLIDHAELARLNREARAESVEHIITITPLLEKLDEGEAGE